MVWQQLFQSHILERGLDYYNQDFVEDLDIKEDRIKAIVYGSEEYDVYIDMVDGKVINMSCTCPYANDGRHCKHMAAVLFYVEEVSEIELGEREGISKLVKEADEIVVRNFLIHILKNDERLVNRFRNVLCCEISPGDIKGYKNQVDSIFSKYAGKEDFVDYYNAWSFISELEEFLYEEIQDMLKDKQYEEAFELSNYIFIKVGNQDMDDSDGGTSMIAERCLEVWHEILDYCNIDLSRGAFKWYINHLDGTLMDYMKEYIEQIIFESFKEEEFLLNKLKYTEDKISEYKKETDSWTRRYNVGNWAVRYLGILEEQKVKQTVIDEYCKDNLEFDSVRKYYISNCIKKKDYKTAVDVLKEGKEMDKDLPGLVTYYSFQLKELYKEIDNQKDYEEELWSLVLKYKAGDMDIYKELKSLYTQVEWEEKREMIFTKLSPYAGVDKFYELEGLNDRLIKFVLDSSGLYKLREYEKTLKEIYPQELLEKYAIVVNNMASRTSDRRQYQEMVLILRRMQKYPGGKERVTKIADDWKYAYRNRPAMMDELKKI